MESKTRFHPANSSTFKALHDLDLPAGDVEVSTLDPVGSYYCWWFRNPKQPPGMVLKPRK